MRLIFLSWAFPPMAYPRATQVQRLAAHVKRWPLEIFCLEPTDNRIVRKRDPSGTLEIVRIPRALPTRILERVLSDRRRSLLHEYDVKYLWWRLAARHLLKSKLTAKDVLVTFGQPMVDHLAGLAVKGRTGVHWIAHFSDPWADNPFDPKAEAKCGLERAVIEASDRVIFTSQETIDLVMAKYPESYRNKVSVLPHCFDPTNYPSVKPNGPRTVVRFMGNLFAGRGPDSLLRALTLIQKRSPTVLEKAQFEFIGEADESARNHPLLTQLPSHCVRFLPKVSHKKAMELMTSADLLLNIDAPASVSVFLPSKLVEYLGAARPIFGITPPGTARRLIEDVGGWAADPQNVLEIADKLTIALTEVGRFRGVPWGEDVVRRRYAAVNVASVFEDNVNAVIEGNKNEK